MGFFKPAEDADEAEEGTAGGDEGAAGDAGDDDGSLTASAEGEGSDALADLGVDLDDGGAGAGF